MHHCLRGWGLKAQCFVLEVKLNAGQSGILQIPEARELRSGRWILQRGEGLAGWTINRVVVKIRVPFWGTLNNRCRTIIRTPKGTIFLTTTPLRFCTAQAGETEVQRLRTELPSERRRREALAGALKQNEPLAQ